MCLGGDFRHLGPGARTRLSNRPIGRRAAERTYPDAGYFDANVEHLAVGLRVRIVAAENLVPAGEIRARHVLQAVRRVISVARQLRCVGDEQCNQNRCKNGEKKYVNWGRVDRESFN